MDRFIAIDVETANEKRSSICQIGMAVFENDQLVDTWETLVNPEDYFLPLNQKIHGIAEEDVENAPTIDEIASEVKRRLENELVVSYSVFDRQAINSAFGEIDYQWLDVVRIVRRTWDNFAYKGYGLANVTAQLGIDNRNHHQALSDAIACGRVLLTAKHETNATLDEIIKLSNRTLKYIRKRKGLIEPKETREPNQEGAFFGESIVFTGQMKATRDHLTVVALNAGFDVRSGISKKVSILVQGQQDPTKIKGELSGKEKKAYELIKKGHELQIISEEDFWALMES